MSEELEALAKVIASLQKKADRYKYLRNHFHGLVDELQEEIIALKTEITSYKDKQ